MNKNEDEKSEKAGEKSSRSNFIREFIDEDLRQGKNDGRVMTRFPPEPNGYLHIGHAKSICLNFGIAADYQGVCNLRFDDTNPITEEMEYVESIMEDIRWLGFDWEDRQYFASDYFDQLYEWAIYLIKKGKAFVCELNEEQIREMRGDFYKPGQESPYRDRSIEENLDLFERMRAGEFPDGSKVLRAKIDMTASNMNLRDPIIYRIKHAMHHRTGDKWCIYPMYDFAHGQSDAVEGITHSICTLEFEDHRPLYDWYLRELDLVDPPRQIEFARLNLNYTVVSKRKLLELVEDGTVDGWNDPRMPTLSGLRRRGFTSASIRNFSDRVGVAKADSIVDVAMLEHSVREDLNANAKRVMGVLRPLRMILENYPEGQIEEIDAPYLPEDFSMGSRKVPFSRELYIERDDFREDPPGKWFRLAPGREVRLRYACVVKCESVVKDEKTGEVIEVRCSWDPNSRGGAPADGRRIKGTLHWVSAAHAIDAEVRLYDRLFNVSNPLDSSDGRDWKEYINPDSLEILQGCKLEPSLAEAKTGEHCQFERLGYFCLDTKYTTAEKPVFNRTVTLRDTWAKIEATQKQKQPKQSKKAKKPQQKDQPAKAETPDETAPTISIDDFARVDLRVAKVTAASAVEGAKKLLRLELDLGPLGQREVFAGIARHVSDPQELVGKMVVCVANLAAWKMKFGTSEGMALAAVGQEEKGEHVTLVEVPDGKPGERIQ